MSKKLMFEDVCAQAQKIIKAPQTQSAKPVVAAWGLMNVGKSYLLNMLTNHIETECFKTNDVRETAELKRFETDKFCFLDTPGLDASQADDVIANAGADQADIILFVHQLQGELEQKEIEFLTTIKKSFGEHAEENIIIVLSKIDKDNTKNIESIQSSIQEQCEHILGFQPKIFQVSGKRFKDGILKDQDQMVDLSQVKQLSNHLEQLGVEVSEIRRARETQKIEEVTAMINALETELTCDIKDLKNQLTTSLAPFNSEMETLHNWLNTRANQYRQL
ncbi:Hypothetical protein F387_01825 [Wohlfahrtiimonas chitiniclastica SH04]|uniref:G domain-containing protein n=1 Tax=Wohlfahrtiimonas chitiniclastica SH04 TaxID=1261130 RepID=L8XXB4_9GAMM|nr:MULTISPECIES: GTPase [Wohlfahrtiimonas]ELV07405.1 Hypothetical protein F387_01825 [Wohlfahrtiimonas chitiniclastica SH04]OYQ74342.1 hypothetical protein B9T20_03470 [Wohlfahrtiimonas sp. G9077]